MTVTITSTGIFLDGAQLAPGMVPIETKIANDQATLDFTSGMDGTYPAYKIIGVGVRPTADASLRFQHYTNATLYTTSAYQWHYARISPSAVSFGAGTNTNYCEILDDVGKEVNEGCGFELTIFTPSNVALWNKTHWKANRVNSAGTTYGAEGYGRDSETTGSIDGIRFHFQGADILEGEFTLIGLSAVL